MLARFRWCGPALLAAALAGSSGALAGVLLEPTEAPEWKVREWINEDPGRLAAQRGKVVLINFFQIWCPGSREFSVPLFQKWYEEFGSRDDVLVVSIHTVFEGHAEQTPERLREFVAERGIRHPVGIDAPDKDGGPVPVTMKRFETGGTPHVAIVDGKGDLRFSHFGRFDPAPVERFITRILEDEAEEARNIRSEPRSKVQSPSRRANQRRADRRKEAPPLRPEHVDDPEEEPPPPMDTGSPDADSADDEADEVEPATREPDEEEPESPIEPDRSLTGSYRLRFEELSKTCGEPSRPVDVITQVTVFPDRIEANFSRAVLGLRRLTLRFDEGSGQFDTDVQQQARDRGGVTVDLDLQVRGRFVNIAEPPEVEYDYRFEKLSEDGSLDCIIEGRGGGPRFRGR